MNLSIIRSLWLLTAAAASAATHAVLPGEAIQPKIDAAAPGDIIAIFGGTYPGDVTINKAVRLVEVDGQEVTITGNVTWNGVTNAPPFEGFTVGSSGKRITVNNTTGLVIKSINSSAGSAISINGASEVGIVGGSYTGITQDGGNLAVSMATVSGDFNSTQNCVKTVAFRTAISLDVGWNSSKAWLGYSSCRRFTFSGSNAMVVVLGSVLDSANIAWDGVILQGNNNMFSIINSTVKGVRHGDQSYESISPVGQNFGWVHVPVYGRSIVLAGSQNQLFAINNYISMNDVGYVFDRDTGYGIRVDSGIARVYNNIFQSNRASVSAAFGNDIRNNFYYNCRSLATGGVVESGQITGNPLFVSGLAPTLQPTSPCINSGINDPIFNDFDGTRNDIGPGGGCLFDPDGWTTNKPVVISFDLAPQQLLKGVDTQVTISNGQAVAQP